mgnify:CR=1 FL=1|tara:strand:- start:330 stop:506 length:177 start_codon:yes stop_codon:yes gene_type:complete
MTYTINGKLKEKIERLAIELVCISCLSTQSTARVIKNDKCCVVCGLTMNPDNLSDIEV